MDTRFTSRVHTPQPRVGLIHVQFVVGELLILERISLNNSFKNKKQLGLLNNKEMKINDIYGLDIDNFRKFKSQTFDLGKNLTIIFGRNGTLKSSLMGLLAQPFRTNHKNILDKKMQTKLSDVFKFSLKKDNSSYLYSIKMDIDSGLKVCEPIPLYPEKDPDTGQVSRFRLVPSGRSAGDGYFNLPSVYSKLDRVFPLTDFKNDPIKNQDIMFTDKENSDIGKFFEYVLLRPDFNSTENYDASEGRVTKHTFAPGNSYYDINSISSGEDNLGSFINTMISFQRVFEKNKNNNMDVLTGLWSIDEFEVSLHPIAQNNLLKYLFDWSKKYRVKIVINTHSLSLIQYSYELRNNNEDAITLNLISSAFVSDNQLSIIKNPSYSAAYSELTLSKISDNTLEKEFKITLFCEDVVAYKYLKKILNKQTFSKYINWQYEVDSSKTGTSYTLLDKLCSNYPSILNQVNAIVISDADRNNSLSTNKTFKRHYAIPSIYQFPIEKELVQWILNLEGNDVFFKKNKKSKDIFKNEIKQYNIPLNIEQTKECKTKYYKNWYKSDIREHGKYITQYLKTNQQIFDPFRERIYKDISIIMKEHGIKVV